MDGYDLIYNIEKKRINELATRGSSKETSGSSYNRIAYNVFRSLYPPEMNIFDAESMGFVDTARQYVDYLQSKRKGSDKLSREEVQAEVEKTIAKLRDSNTPAEEKEKIESIAGSTAAIKKAGQLANRIWSRVKDYVKRHEGSGVTDQMVQSWILDPDNEVGQEILSGIRGPGGSARVVGIDGEPVVGWSKELWSGTSDGSSQDVSDEDDSDEESTSEKPNIFKDPIATTRDQQKTVDQYRGRSKIPEENRKYFTEFIKKVLKQAHSSGILKTISIVGKDQGGRASGRDISSYEFAVTQAVKPIISSIAYNFADIAVNALIQYELISADPSFTPNWTRTESLTGQDVDPNDLKNIDNPIYKNVKPVDQSMTADLANEIFSKIKNQMELTGIQLLPATIKEMAKKWIKMAHKNLELSGFDDNLGKELEYYHRRIKGIEQGETYKLSSAIKQAIQNTTEDIATDLYNNTEFVKTFVNFIIDSEEVKKMLRELDPTVKDREDELKKVQQQRQYKYSKIGSLSKRRPGQERIPPMNKRPAPERQPLPDEPSSEIGESLQTFKKYLGR